MRKNNEYLHYIYNKALREKGGISMADYNEMYYKLFNQVTDTIEQLKKLQQQLQDALQSAEEIYIESSEGGEQ